MNFIQKWLFKRKRFKLFLNTLRPYLKHKYGQSGNLTYKQVNEALIYLELAGTLDEYAYAMALSRSQFKNYRNNHNIMYTQGALQSELGVSTELLETHFPGGNY